MLNYISGRKANNALSGYKILRVYLPPQRHRFANLIVVEIELTKRIIKNQKADLSGMRFLPR